MSLATFIPEVWVAVMIESLKKRLVFAQPGVVNRNYEGAIAEAGDTVTINSVSRPTIGTYERATTVITPEQLTLAARKLTITESKYFAFEVDDVDKRQALGDTLAAGLSEAVYGLRDVADQFVAGLYTGVQAANALGTRAVTSGALAYQVLVDLKTVLDEANVPTEGRYVIVPPWFHGLLLTEDKFVRVDASGTSEALRNGMVGRAVGFDILVSNNTVNVSGDDWIVQAGVPGALTYAEQINKVEAYRPENSFSDALKGLHLYGAKLIRPDSIATLVASKT